MGASFIPSNYKSTLGIYDTQAAIELIKKTFIGYLAGELNLRRVTAPLFVSTESGLNDNLNGFERAVSFDIPAAKAEAQVVHSLAKWKRMALKKYNFSVNEGLYTDMNAIRRDEELDNIHSIYVDQWDWCQIITKEQRTEMYLKATVIRIIDALCKTLSEVKMAFPSVTTEIENKVTFVTTQELEDLYPGKTAKERETLFTKEHKTVFIMQIGDKLKSGEKHDGRAPDYDDWKLNGDILVWNDVLNSALEISSMGIRVDEKAMREQLEKANCLDRQELPFHKALLAGELPLTIGGGIGQSRVCMLLLQKAHIGEVQSSLWDEHTLKICAENGVQIL